MAREDSLRSLRKRLEERHHAVIVVAEGAGQEFFEQSGSRERCFRKYKA